MRAIFPSAMAALHRARAQRADRELLWISRPSGVATIFAECVVLSEDSPDIIARHSPITFCGLPVVISSRVPEGTIRLVSVRDVGSVDYAVREDTVLP